MRALGALSDLEPELPPARAVRPRVFDLAPAVVVTVGIHDDDARGMRRR